MPPNSVTHPCDTWHVCALRVLADAGGSYDACHVRSPVLPVLLVFSVLFRPLGFISGTCYNPTSPLPLPVFVAGSPAWLPVRQYPDICHAVHAQFPVPSWHWAWSVTHGRNPVIPMPRHAANIVRLNANGSSPTYGVGAYSEGLSDDLNKVVWSLLAAEPGTTTTDVVRQYARYHFGAEHEDAMATALFGLESNWASDPLDDSSSVLATLATLQHVENETAAAGALEGNWRLQSYLYRGYFDAVVQVGNAHALCNQPLMLYTCQPPITGAFQAPREMTQRGLWLLAFIVCRQGIGRRKPPSKRPTLPSGPRLLLAARRRSQRPARRWPRVRSIRSPTGGAPGFWSWPRC